MQASLTWHDGDRLEGPEDPEGPEAGEVAHLDEGGEVAGGDHREVQPVPGVPARPTEHPRFYRKHLIFAFKNIAVSMAMASS